jgi:hypothetical protein
MPGGETEKDVSAWTVDSLKEYVLALMSQHDRRLTELGMEKNLRDEQRFQAQQTAVRDALTAQQQSVGAALLAAQDAVNKAETAAEKRFDAVNEFRAQLADQAATLMPRQETQVLLDNLAQRITSLERRINEAGGRSSGLDAAWGYAIGALGFLIAVATLVIYATH